jgi:hypothetical protein
MAEKSEGRFIAAGKRDVLHRIDAELIDWLDGESETFQRPRAFLVEHAIRMWRRRLERERGRRKGRRRR